MSRTSQFPRPLAVAPSLSEAGWFWYCRKCDEARGTYLITWTGWEATCGDANTAAREHWKRCPNTPAEFRRTMDAYRSSNTEAGL